MTFMITVMPNPLYFTPLIISLRFYKHIKNILNYYLFAKVLNCCKQ